MNTYGGVFENTVPLLRRYLAGMTILHNDGVIVAGVRYFGTMLWSDFENRNDAATETTWCGMGDYLTKTRSGSEDGSLLKLRPADALAAQARALKNNYEN